MKYSTRHLYFALILLTGVFFASRVPFYQQKLGGEEGIFAYLFIHDVAKPNYLLLSRVNGVDLMCAPQHPGPMYAAVNSAGKLVGNFVDFSKLDEQASAVALRVIFSLPLFFLFALTTCYLHQTRNNNFYYWLLLFLAFVSSPVVLVTSTELQIDASYGTAIIGFWAFAVLALSDAKHGKIKALLFFLGTFVASLGKNEWSFVLLLSLLLGAAYAVMMRDRAGSGANLKLLLFGFAGFMLGNLANYFFDPLNYLAGLDLMLSMSKNESIANSSKFTYMVGITRNRWIFVSYNILFLLTSWLCLRPGKYARFLDRLLLISLLIGGFYFVSLWTEYLPVHLLSFFVPLALMMLSVMSASAVLRRAKADLASNPLVFIPLFFSALLFAAYFVSAWDRGGPRYFALGLTVSLFSLPGLLKRFDTLSQKKIIVNLTACMLVLNLVAYLNLDSFNRIVPHPSRLVTGQSGDDCLPVMSSGEAVFKRIDFLGGSCSTAYFEEMSQKYRKPLCK